MINKIMVCNELCISIYKIRGKEKHHEDQFYCEEQIFWQDADRMVQDGVFNVRCSADDPAGQIVCRTVQTYLRFM